MAEIALYQPDIAQNAGTVIRLGACLGCPVHIIEPAGFQLTERGLRRAGMDYIDAAVIQRHESFDTFNAWRETQGKRLILFTTHSSEPYTEFDFRASDILLYGRESAGVPKDVHEIANASLKIPMKASARSINVALSVAMTVGEALRQTATFPHDLNMTK